MPNYCDNSLLIDAEDEVIEQILEYIRNDKNVFDFNKIIPMPEIEKENWVNWCCENWGTKWNAVDPEVYDNLISFSTAWSPCSPVVAKLAMLFPEAEFRYEYDEYGWGFVGMEIYSGGELIYEFSGNDDKDKSYQSNENDPSEFILSQKDMFPIQESGTMSHTVFKYCENDFTYEEAYVREYANGQIMRKVNGEIRYKGKRPKYLLMSQEWTLYI